MDSPPMTTVAMTARIRELEEETRGLQKLVCYLLQKNELLRQRPQSASEENYLRLFLQNPGCDSY